MRALAVIVAALALAAPAAAANWPDSRLDAVATQVSGHPVSVWCETSFTDWPSLVAAHGRTGSETLEGFTTTTPGMIWLSPRVCDTLHADLADGAAGGGIYWSAEAIPVLLHESVHQRNIGTPAFADEGLTDCTALSLLPTYAATFGFPPTVTASSGRWRPIYRRLRHRRTVRWVWIATTTTATNPLYASLLAWAEAWHRSRPPQYQGNC